MEKKDITFEKKILLTYCMGEAFLNLIDELPEELYTKALKIKGKLFIEELEKVGAVLGNNLYKTDSSLVSNLSTELKDLVGEILGTDTVEPLPIEYVPDVTFGIRKFKQENK